MRPGDHERLESDSLSHPHCKNYSARRKRQPPRREIIIMSVHAPVTSDRVPAELRAEKGRSSCFLNAGPRSSFQIPQSASSKRYRQCPLLAGRRVITFLTGWGSQGRQKTLPGAPSFSARGFSDLIGGSVILARHFLSADEMSSAHKKWHSWHFRSEIFSSEFV